MPALSKGSLEEQRRKLIDFVERKRPQGSLNNTVTVVFDGKSGHYGFEGASTVKIVFSSHETADEKILWLVDEAENRGNIIVVTNDRPVQYAIRALGAKAMEVKEFIEKGDALLIKKPSKGKGAAKKDQPKNIPHTLEHEITEEMRSVWLKEKHSK